MNNKILITKEDQLTANHRNEHPSYEYIKKEVTKRSEFSQCYVAIYEILPQKYNYPFHYHDENTEVFYIISGQGLLSMKDETIEVQAGDIIICPPGEEGVHKLFNSSKDEVLKYLDVDTTNSPDIVHYPDSNKIGIIKHNESSDFYQNEEVYYYDGE